MGVIRYSLVAHDWLNLEYIINDLTRRVVTQDLGPSSIPTFEDVLITGLSGSIISSTSVETSIEELDAAISGLTQDHGGLTGLGDDDHTQYLLVSGTRAMTGDLDLDGFDLLNPGVGHDSFSDFVAGEHFLQTAITNVSTGLATGILKVTTGTGVLSSIVGVSGTLILDDGATEKITLVFTDGILTSRTIEATTSSLLIDWTD